MRRSRHGRASTLRSISAPFSHDPCLGVPYRPQAEASYALPQQQFGLDVMVRAGNLRYGQHRRTTAIHPTLRRRGLDIAARTVRNLRDR